METWRPVGRHRAIMPIPTGSIAAEILPRATRGAAIAALLVVPEGQEAAARTAASSADERTRC